MATHVITVLCDSPADAENALVRIREIGFPIEGEEIVGNDVNLWIDQSKTDGVIFARQQIEDLGLKAIYRSERNG